jgi:Kef-type K+ transport system membrane component KefB
VTDDQLLRFLVELTVLFVAARIGGEVAARLRLPLHVGELAMGIALGPSLFGWLWPGTFHALFPADAASRSLLDVVSWTGVIMLALLAGLETRLGILRTAGRAVLGGWIGGFGLPFAAGLALGMAAPDALVPAGVDRPVFALFLATAMSISAIPVIARILMDLKLYRTRVGMVILSTAIADDTVGWIVLAVVAGLAGGALELGPILRTVLLTAAFVVGSFTLGRLLVDRAIRASRRLRVPFGELSAMLMLVFAFAALTQWIGVHLVLGAFVAAILIGREPDLDPDSVTAVRHLGMGLFVPFFFAYTGIKVDLTTLRGSALGFAAAAVAVACVSKIVGGWAGTRLGGLPHWEALAVGFGLNARGAMELVIAAIGLSIGVLNEPTYATIVLIAVLTTVMAAPMLQFCVRRAGVRAGDAEPLGLEAEEAPAAEPGSMIPL